MIFKACLTSFAVFLRCVGVQNILSQPPLINELELESTGSEREDDLEDRDSQYTPERPATGCMNEQMSKMRIGIWRACWTAGHFPQGM
ncbi:hypothetical protein N7495_003193 [Penicillium taxi]|uniref:uncharacterized protein n=1 Tax=Penicillium taxi TaxID=168475 RepID=UPI00254502C6|nr:uncharacterized protein N7495_003193 [Penicillium taxi]KAJ5902665.1 hypothetical protein N7495_003193 [Penicillium taxi]